MYPGALSDEKKENKQLGAIVWTRRMGFQSTVIVYVKFYWEIKWTKVRKSTSSLNNMEEKCFYGNRKSNVSCEKTVRN